MATASIELIRNTAKAAFWQNFEGRPDIMDGLSFRVDSDSDQEIYPWLLYAPSPTEMKGSRKKIPVPDIDFTIKNKKWESSVPIGYELRRFGKLNQVAALVGELGQKARDYPNSLMSTLVNDGDSTACYDTQFFFDTVHVDPGASYTTSQDNDLGASATTATAPTDVEFAVAVRAAIDAMLGFKDGNGDPVPPPMGSRYVVMVPTGYASIARRVMLVDQLSGPVGNDLKGQFDVVVNPWLTPVGTTAAFYTFNPNGVRKPFIYQVADDVTLEDDAGGDADFNTKEITFGSFGYYNIGYGDWRYAVRTLFS